VQPAKPRKFGVLKARDHPENVGLRAVFQLGLESDHIVERAERIVLAQLDDGIGLDLGLMAVGQPHRLHRAMPQGLAAALGHDLDRQAAVEIGRAFPFLEAGGVARDQGVDKGVVLVLVHRAIDVVAAGAAGPDLVVAGLEPAHRHVDRLGVDDGCDGVEKRQRVLTGLGSDRRGEAGRGERACCDDGLVPIGWRQAGDFFACDRNQRFGFNRGGDGAGKGFAVDSQRAAGGHLVGVSAGHDQRAGQAHFGMDDADGVVFGVIGAE